MLGPGGSDAIKGGRLRREAWVESAHRCGLTPVPRLGRSFGVIRATQAVANDSHTLTKAIEGSPQIVLILASNLRRVLAGCERRELRRLSSTMPPALPAGTSLPTPPAPSRVLRLKLHARISSLRRNSGAQKTAFAGSWFRRGGVCGGRYRYRADEDRSHRAYCEPSLVRLDVLGCRAYHDGE